MKKYLILCAGLCVALSFSSCKSSESAYKKAYERAKAQETVVVKEVEPTTTVVAPVETVQAPVQTQVVPANTTTYDNSDNVNVRKESLSVVNGNGLKDFSVVVGSFGLKANAEGLVNQLRNQGYDAQLAYNSERGLYRVIASTFASKIDAVTSRDKFRAFDPDAWLLFNGK